MIPRAGNNCCRVFCGQLFPTVLRQCWLYMGCVTAYTVSVKQKMTKPLGFPVVL